MSAIACSRNDDATMVRPERIMSENKIIQEDAKVCQMSTFLRGKRLNWYEHSKRREEDNLSRQMMDMVVSGKRGRVRYRLRWNYNNREDMTKFQLTADMTENRQYWKMMLVSKGEKGEKLVSALVSHGDSL